MDVEENNHACKRSRIGSKIGQKEQHQENDDDDGEGKRGGGGGGETRSMPWGVHPSSRIYRVSRASGGKDRHSKVYTAKGLRDRRVRLSVSTAIQFYDLQDRLGYDQPSKAIEWLIKASSAAINELPSLDGSFPESMKQEKPMLEAEVEEEAEGEAAYSQQQNQHLTKSGCSSTSETSKGSVLSLSRSENRVKARERARERTAKDKDKDKDREDGGGGSGSHAASHHYNVNTSLNSQTSFTELLTAGGSSSGAAAITNAQENSSNCRQLPAVTATADYFGQAGLFSTQTLHFGNNSPVGMVPFNIAAAAAAAAASGEHPEMQHFSFLQDHFPSPAVAAGDYNINFSNSPGLAGFNRGTLQSNSPSHQLPHHHHHHHHHHLQRLSPQVEGSNVPFFFGAAVPPAASAVTSADTQFTAGFDGRLQLWDRYRHSDLKGKGKS